MQQPIYLPKSHQKVAALAMLANDESVCLVGKLTLLVKLIFMVALCNRTDHYIFALLFLSSISFFSHLISAAAGWMSTIV